MNALQAALVTYRDALTYEVTKVNEAYRLVLDRVNRSVDKRNSTTLQHDDDTDVLLSDAKRLAKLLTQNVAGHLAAAVAGLLSARPALQQQRYQVVKPEPQRQGPSPGSSWSFSPEAARVSCRTIPYGFAVCDGVCEVPSTQMAFLASLVSLTKSPVTLVPRACLDDIVACETPVCMQRVLEHAVVEHLQPLLACCRRVIVVVSDAAAAQLACCLGGASRSLLPQCVWKTEAQLRRLMRRSAAANRSHGVVAAWKPAAVLTTSSSSSLYSKVEVGVSVVSDNGDAALDDDQGLLELLGVLECRRVPGFALGKQAAQEDAAHHSAAHTDVDEANIALTGADVVVDEPAQTVVHACALPTDGRKRPREGMCDTSASPADADNCTPEKAIVIRRTGSRSSVGGATPHSAARRRQDRESQGVQYAGDDEDFVSPEPARQGLFDHDDTLHGRSGALLLHSVTEQPFFQLSYSVRSHKRELHQLLVSKVLPAECDFGSAYNPAATHLVVADGIMERTEKYLSFCAAGKHIVSPRYITDSVQNASWLPLDTATPNEYELSPVLRRLWSSSVSLSGTILRQRLRYEPPFKHWRVLLIATKKVAAGVTTMLCAGGCTCVLTDPEAPQAWSSQSTSRIEFSRSSSDSCAPLPWMMPPRAIDGLPWHAHLTHVLIEAVTLDGMPSLPNTPPVEALRHDVLLLREKVFTLELLHHCLCVASVSPFSATGALQCSDSGPILPQSCRFKIIEEQQGSNMTAADVGSEGDLAVVPTAPVDAGWDETTAKPL